MTTAEATAVRTYLDLEGGRVTMPGRMLGIEMLQPNLETLLQGEETTFAVMVLSKGDRRPMDLFLTADNAPQQLDVLTIKAALKEFETGRRYDIHEGDGTEFSLVTRDGFPCYRFLMSLSASLMRRILQSYADPRGTFVDLIAEIETQYRYNAADYSPGAVYSESVATGAQTVYVPVPLVQANGTQAYNLSVTGTVLPAYLEGGGWGSAPIYILDQAINITVSGGAVVAATLSIPAGTRGFSNPYQEFIPHWLTSMDPIRIDPITGGLNLRVDVATQPMGTAVFGSMPATVWRAEKVPTWNIWTGNTNYHYGTPNVYSFRDATNTHIGAYTMANGCTAPSAITNGVGNFYPFVGRGNSYTTDFVWKTEPTAKIVQGYIGDPVPVVETTVPTGPTVRFNVVLTAQGDSGDDQVTRVSSQSYVVRLRRDLIPDVAPETGGS